MSYDACRAYGSEQKSSAGTEVLCDTTHIQECRLDLIEAGLRPPLESTAQLAADRLLRECLKRSR
jgi:hypothetical protein